MSLGTGRVQIRPELIKGFGDKVRKDVEDGTSGLSGQLGGLAKTLAAGFVAGFAIKKAFDIGGDAVDKFKEVAGETGKLMRVTGGSAEEMSKLRYAASTVGIQGDKLTGAFVKLSKAGLGASSKSFADMGISMKDSTGAMRPLTDVLGDVGDKFKTMPDGAQKNADALKLFGKSGADLIPLLNKGSDGFKALAIESDKYGMTLSGSQVKDAKESAKAQREWTASTDGLKVALGSALLPIMTKVSQFITAFVLPAFQTIRRVIADDIVPALQRFWDRLEPLRETIARVVDAIWNFIKTNMTEVLVGLGAGVITFAAIMLSSMIPTLVTAAASFWAATTAMWSFLWPIALIVAAVAGLAAGIVYAYNHFDWFHKAVDAVWQGIQAVIGAVVGWIQENVWPVIQRILGWIGDGFVRLWGWAKEAWDGISKVIGKVVDWIVANIWPVIKKVIGWIADGFGNLVKWVREHWDQIKNAISEVWGTITGILSVAMTVIMTIFKVGFAVVRAVFEVVWPIISKVVSIAMDVIKSIISFVVDFVLGLWHTFGDTIMSVFRIAWDTVKSILQGVWDFVVGIFAFFNDLFHGRWGQLWQDVKDVFFGVWDAIKAFFLALPRVLLELLRDAGTWLLEKGKALLTGMWDGIKSGASSVWDWFKSLPGAILGAVGDLGRTLWDAGKNLMSGLWEGMQSVGSKALDIAKGIANGIIGFINDKLIGGLNGSLDLVWRNIPFTSGNFPYHIPNIPKFHDGGVFSAGGGEGLALLRHGEGIFTPEQMKAMGGGRGVGRTYNLNTQTLITSKPVEEQFALMELLAS